MKKGTTMEQKVKYHMTIMLLFIAMSAEAYDVSITPPSNGAVTISSTSQNASTTVTLTVKPDDGYYITANDITITPTGDGSIAQTRTPDIATPFIPQATNINAEGKGTYTFTMPTANARIDATFKSRETINEALINLNETSFIYNGSVQRPTISSVKTSDGTITFASSESTNGYADYDVNIPNSATVTENPYSVTITFRGMYTGVATAEYSIKPQPLDAATINSTASLSSTSLNYTGEAQAPEVTIEGMTEGTDFTIKYKEGDKDATSEKPKDTGTYSIIIIGIGNYSGEVDTNKSFTIAEKPQQGNDDQSGPAKDEDTPQQEIINVDQAEPVIVDGEPLYELTEEVKESLKLTFDAEIYLPLEANTRTTITEYGGLSFTKGSDVKMVVKDLELNSTLRFIFYGKLYGDSHYISSKSTIGSSTRSEGDMELVSGADYHVDTAGDMLIVIKLNETGATIKSIDVTNPGSSSTSIESIEYDAFSSWFDLQGHKLSIKPSTKGLYISNGKKVVIK